MFLVAFNDFYSSDMYKSFSSQIQIVMIILHLNGLGLTAF